MGDHIKFVVAVETGDTLAVHRPQTDREAGQIGRGAPVFASWSRDECHVLERS
jgi:hypothetical protein